MEVSGKGGVLLEVHRLKCLFDCFAGFVVPLKFEQALGELHPEICLFGIKSE